MIQKYKDLSFRRKCFLICLLASLLPILLLGTFCYKEMKTILIDREKTALRETLVQESSMLEAKLDRFVQGSRYICWNNNINQALSRKYEFVSEMYLFYRDTLDPLIVSTKVLNPEIDNITIYTDTMINPHGSALRPLEDVEGQNWYETVCSDYLDHWIISAEDQMLSLVTQIYDMDNGHTALVKMDFLYASTFASMQMLYEQSYGILLADRNGSLFYQFHTEDLIDQPLSVEAIQKGGPLLDEYVVETVSGIGDNWTIYLYRPMESILIPVQEIIKLMWIIIPLSILCAIVVSSLLSANIVRPLENLTAEMEQVKVGALVSHASYDSKDEIGILTKAFNQMVERLNGLIEQLIQEKVLQKEYELRALQAQINPHFLYNSLSLINSKAILSEQDEISQMAQFLATFYRTTLNKGKSVTFVRDELENIRSYVSIQALMHSNGFEVVYDVSEEILNYTMPNLLLQPLVENAIQHGIDCIETGEKGRLKITGILAVDAFEFRVSDNGPGIPPEKLDSILTIGTNEGYGVQNVNQRVQLICGMEYGLSYEHACSHGTCAILRLPAAAE